MNIYQILLFINSFTISHTQADKSTVKPADTKFKQYYRKNKERIHDIGLVILVISSCGILYNLAIYSRASERSSALNTNSSSMHTENKTTHRDNQNLITGKLLSSVNIIENMTKVMQTVKTDISHFNIIAKRIVALSKYSIHERKLLLDIIKHVIYYQQSFESLTYAANSEHYDSNINIEDNIIYMRLPSSFTKDTLALVILENAIQKAEKVLKYKQEIPSAAIQIDQDLTFKIMSSFLLNDMIIKHIDTIINSERPCEFNIYIDSDWLISTQTQKVEQKAVKRLNEFSDYANLQSNNDGLKAVLQVGLSDFWSELKGFLYSPDTLDRACNAVNAHLSAKSDNQTMLCVYEDETSYNGPRMSYYPYASYNDNSLTIRTDYTKLRKLFTISFYIDDVLIANT